MLENSLSLLKKISVFFVPYNNLCLFPKGLSCSMMLLASGQRVRCLSALTVIGANTTVSTEMLGLCAQVSIEVVFSSILVFLHKVLVVMHEYCSISNSILKFLGINLQSASTMCENCSGVVIVIP